jgi:hypothetical protein
MFPMQTCIQIPHHIKSFYFIAYIHSRSELPRSRVHLIVTICINWLFKTKHWSSNLIATSVSSLLHIPDLHISGRKQSPLSPSHPHTGTAVLSRNQLQVFFWGMSSHVDDEIWGLATNLHPATVLFRRSLLCCSNPHWEETSTRCILQGRWRLPFPYQFPMGTGGIAVETMAWAS